MKRLFDIFVASTTILLLSPVLLFLSLLVYWKNGSPIFFKQIRPGRNARPFCMIKFRTMTNEYDSNGQILTDEQRLTPLGRWLRKTSLDELPELCNVLKGDMSLVGPRPLLMEYVPLYTIEQARRHEVKPGITGWAQINGRNALHWEEKFKLDIWYVDNQSLLLDIKILIKTIHIAIFHKGIHYKGEATMYKFTGTKINY